MQELKLTHSATAGALARWQAQGLITMVRKNLYVIIDPTTGAPIADKYELSCKVSATSYIGWHTALEFHGVAPVSYTHLKDSKKLSDYTA